MDPGPDASVNEERRAFLRTAVLASGALALGGAAAVISGTLRQSQEQEDQGKVVFPRLRIIDVNDGTVANVNTLEANEPVAFDYPLDDEPSVLVKLGQKAENGVGPDADIVAFSVVCQHLGCVVGYVPQGGSPSCDSESTAQYPQLYCCCHYATYNLLQDGAASGQTPVPVPRIVLEVDSESGDIYATSMMPPVINGRGAVGSTDVALDLVD